MLKDFKENKWDPVHKKTLAETTKKLQAFEAANPDCSGAEKATKEDYEIIDARRERHLKGESHSFTWEQAKQKIQRI